MIIVYVIADLVVAWGGQTQEGCGLYGISSLETLKDEKKKEGEEKGEHHYCVERYSRSFQSVFQLSSSVQADKIEASFDKGVLKVIIPKPEEAKKKEIEIKVNIFVSPLPGKSSGLKL